MAFAGESSGRAGRCGSWFGNPHRGRAPLVQLISSLTGTQLRRSLPRIFGADGERAVQRRHIAEALLLGLLLLAASGRFVYTAWRNDELSLLRQVFLQYKSATLAVDFVDFGAVHRGLGGSLARLFTADAVDAAIAFHLASGLAVACVLGLLFARFQVPVVRRLAFAVVALALMMRWGEDGGRTDLAVVALLGAATLAWLSGRIVVAALTVGLGLFIHEASAILGVPLLAALAWRDVSRGDLKRQRVHTLLVILAAVLAVYFAFPWLPHSTNPEIAARVHERVGSNEAVDVALYFALAGLRGIQAAMCANAKDPAASMHVAMGLVVIAVTTLALAPWRGANRWLTLLAGLPGYVLLASVANDYARWTLFACMALWLFAISAPRAAAASSDRRVALADVACLAAGCILALALVPATRPGISRVVSPVPRLDQWLYRSPDPKPLGFAEVVARCDPRWRDVLRANP